MRTAQCAPLKHHYDECAERVQQQEQEHGKAHEDCVEECKSFSLRRNTMYSRGPASARDADMSTDFHMMHCASQCAAPKLFRQLR